MASQTGNLKAVPLSPNMADMFYVEFEVTSALANTETATLTLPDGVNKNCIPLTLSIWSAADPRLPQHQPHKATGAVLTSYDKDTGVVVITSGAGTVVDNSTIGILFAPLLLGS